MENVVLTVHLILAVMLIVVVLLQRSEGGGLGMGSGGGGGVMTGRQAANAMSRATWLLAAGFIVTSMALTVLAARSSASGSLLDRIEGTQSAPGTPGLPQLPAYTPPPAAGQPITPPVAAVPAGAATAPAAAPAAAVPETSAPAPQPAAPIPAPADGASAGGSVTTTTRVPVQTPTN